MLADASGDLSERPWNKLSIMDDRMVSSASSAVIQELITGDALSDRYHTVTNFHIEMLFLGPQFGTHFVITVHYFWNYYHI